MIGENLGKYAILQTIGTGSMGTVYLAEDTSDGRRVAVKRVPAHVLSDREKRERFLQDLLVVSAIHHKGICPILEIGDDDDDFFVVMPYLEGKTLARFMDGKALAWPLALQIALSVGEALSAAHAAGAVHRGLKPANVWILGGGNALVSDCGLARFTEVEQSSQPSRMKLDFAAEHIPMTALAHMSPEQVRGAAVDYRTDIFAFGALLYQMLAGRHPFESRNSVSRMNAILEADPPALTPREPSIPPEFDLVIRKALAKSPEDRPQSMQEILLELRAIPAPEPHPAMIPAELSGKRGWDSLSPRVVLALLLLTVMVLTLYYFKTK